MTNTNRTAGFATTKLFSLQTPGCPSWPIPCTTLPRAGLSTVVQRTSIRFSAHITFFDRAQYCAGTKTTLVSVMMAGALINISACTKDCAATSLKQLLMTLKSICATNPILSSTTWSSRHDIGGWPTGSGCSGKWSRPSISPQNMAMMLLSDWLSELKAYLDTTPKWTSTRTSCRQQHPGRTH